LVIVTVLVTPSSGHFPGPAPILIGEKLPYYLGFFEFVHNQRKRGGALLDSLLDTLLAPDKRTKKTNI